MQKIKLFFSKWSRDEEGASALEYALMAGLIAVAIVTTVQGLGGNIDSVFQKISTILQGVTPGGSGGNS
ncbi:fimbriae protein [Methylocaldum marinum]|uniref:Fimbriae protein n=1 Tax=Methylocaldum marinum TaxID=1432792 RepID=A0A250KLU3_9GAMM|nr:Flp family type IVb pilin [Methylocaldum marinum]BBA32516.1 fimbriae protein [Methylocaldum marinum]